MSDTSLKTTSSETTAAPETGAASVKASSVETGRGRQEGQGGRNRSGNGQGGRRRGRGRERGDRREEKSEFDSTIVDLARVTRVMGGGKRMSFRACVVLGDRKGRIGMGVKKGNDVQLAIAKATEYAKKHMMNVSVIDGTIPHTIEKKFKGARLLLKPAKAGTGLIAGGSVRLVLELAGVHNIVAKMKGSGNKISNVAVTLEALRSLTLPETIKQLKSK